jgi:hypothetical protein
MSWCHRWFSDRLLDNHLVSGLRRRLPNADVVRVQDAALSGSPDESVLAWCAREARVLLTHDASTMTAAAYARIAGGKACPGVIIIPQWLPVGPTLEELILIAECSGPEDWVDQVRFLPLK